MVENLLLFRIDERLTHGQVMISYMKKYPAKAILCIDDATAKDTFLSDIIAMSAPPGVEMKVVTVEAAGRIIAEGLTKPTIMLAKSPVTVKQLREAGAPIDDFIIGGISKAPGKKTLYKSISISDEELEAVKAMLAEGVNIDIQILASDKRQPAKNFIREEKKC